MKNRAMSDVAVSVKDVICLAKTKRHKFPVPRRRYRASKKNKSETQRVFEAIKDHAFDSGLSIGDIARKYKIPRSTVYYWNSRLDHDSSYTPLESKCGRHLRVFTDEQEIELARRIREQYIYKHVYFTNQDFRELAISYWNELNISKPFNCSDGFITAFKKRHKFCSKRPHLKRRPKTEWKSEEAWKAEIRDLLRRDDVSLDYVLNCDETSWRLFPNGLLTWSEPGAENVSVTIDGDEKAAISVLATISANGHKMPLFIVAKGSTDRVEQSQLGNVGYHWRCHSPSGWMTSDIFGLYLMHLTGTDLCLELSSLSLKCGSICFILVLRIEQRNARERWRSKFVIDDWVCPKAEVYEAETIWNHSTH